MKKSQIVCMIMVVAILGCNKKYTLLPPDKQIATSSGKNIAAFNVDGVYHYYEQEKKFTLGGTPEVVFGHTTTLFGGIFLSVHISSNNSINKYNDELSIYVTSDTLLENVRYKITGNYYADYYQYNPHRIDSNNSYLILTRLDSNVIAGEFEFLGKNDSLPDTHVTSGWFDASR